MTAAMTERVKQLFITSSCASCSGVGTVTAGMGRFFVSLIAAPTSEGVVLKADRCSLDQGSGARGGWPYRAVAQVHKEHQIVLDGESKELRARAAQSVRRARSSVRLLGTPFCR